MRPAVWDRNRLAFLGLRLNGFWYCSTVFLQDLLQGWSSDGFWEEEVHARVHTFFDIAFFGKCSQSNYGCRIAHATNESGALETV